jgi:hypothetical protein
MSALLFLGYALVVATWSARNSRLQGVFTVVDTMGGMNLRMGNYEFTPWDRMWDAVALVGEKNWAFELSREHPEAAAWTEGQKEKWARAKTVQYVREHPVLTVQRSIVRFADFWGLERELVAGFQQRLYQPLVWVIAVASAAVTISYPAVMVCAVLGLFLARPRDTQAHIFLIILIAFICGTHTLVFGHSRYHLPLIPFLALYAAAALGHRSWTASRERLSVAGPTMTMAILFTVWAREIFVRDADRIRQLVSILR